MAVWLNFLPGEQEGGGYLVCGDLHVVLDVGEHGGLNEEAFVSVARAATLKGGALFLAALDQREDFIELLLVNL